METVSSHQGSGHTWDLKEIMCAPFVFKSFLRRKTYLHFWARVICPSFANWDFFKIPFFTFPSFLSLLRPAPLPPCVKEVFIAFPPFVKEVFIGLPVKDVFLALAPFVKEPLPLPPLAKEAFMAFIAFGGIWAKKTCLVFEPLLKWLQHLVSVGVIVGESVSVCRCWVFVFAILGKVCLFVFVRVCVWICMCMCVFVWG